MNTNTNIKQGYKQTSLGILPQEWEVVRLGDICEIIMGQSPSGHAVIASERSERGNPQKFTKTLTIDCHENSNGFSRNDKAVEFHQGKIYFTDKFLAKSDFVTTEPLKIAEPNSILLCVRAPVGVVNFTQRKIAIGRGLCAIKANKAHNEFIYFILLSLKDYFETKSAGSTFSAINSNEVKNVKIPLPPLAEQEKIAQILGVWDKGISVLKSLIEAKTKRKKALMQRLLTPPTHPLTPSAREGEQKSHHDTKAPPLAGGVGVGYSHIENNRNDDKVLDCHDLTASNLAMTEKNSKAKQSLRFAEFTDKWQEMRLGDILQEKSIKNTSNVNLVLSVTNKQGFVAQKDYFEQEVASNDTGNYKVVYKYEFAYNPARINVGSIAMLEKFEIGILSPMYVVFKCLEKVDNCFFRYWLESHNFTGVLHRYLSGSVRETLSFNDMKTMHIFLPTLVEQKKIAQVLSACDKEIELLKSKFQCLKTQKKGLMQRLLNGEVRVKC